MIRRHHLDADDEWREDFWADLRAACLRFRRDNPHDEANTWGPLSVDELAWLVDYDKERRR